MKNRIVFVLFIYFVSIHWTFAQMSHGGTPLFLENAALRSTANAGFIEMPAFNMDSVLRLDEINQTNMRGSFQFAHKFYTHIEKGKDGSETVLADGTKVWQVGIRSKGAYSLNMLFTEFHIPEGAKLFIYNTDHSYIIGSFDYRNHSADGILPVRPVDGETVIVEYSEPADAAFEGRLVIGEVNHDYRGVLRTEPGTDIGEFSCMRDVLCEEVDESMTRATVMVMINGTGACTGTLLNNTENDGRPYVLTAVHCLNSELQNNISKDKDHYVNVAGTIITFFNYNRPVCGNNMRATEELSLAVAYPRVIIEKKDLALLELREKPPVYYNAYYAGWDIDLHYSAPYTNLHHPHRAVKKYNLYEGSLSRASYPEPIFDANSHFKVTNWTIGSTYGGSSGSPLFSSDRLLIGGLSGGNSVCNGTSPANGTDYFFSLAWAWEDQKNVIQPSVLVKDYLDPKTTGVQQLESFDPNKENPVRRISNARYNDGDKLIATEYKAPYNGFLFGNSDVRVVEFAEEFNLENTGTLYGASLFIPPMLYLYTENIEVGVYEGSAAPENLIATQAFKPQYLNYSAGGFQNENKVLGVATENLVVFDQPVKVNRKFYVAYSIPYSERNEFAVYNTQFASSASPNTAWIKDEQGKWTSADKYARQPLSTALAIQPVWQYRDETAIQKIEKGRKSSIRYMRSENRLLLAGELPESGQVYVYDASGRLLQKIPVPQGQNSIVLHPQSNGSIGIVRIVQGNDVYTGKFIY